jgi:hypothetical protein
MECAVVAVSPDTDNVHRTWQKAEKELADVRFSMAADPTGKVSRLFGVYDERAGLAPRGTFIINPDGALLNAEVNFSKLGRNIDELMRRFEANIYVSKKTSEGIPGARGQPPGDGEQPRPRAPAGTRGSGGDVGGLDALDAGPRDVLPGLAQRAAGVDAPGGVLDHIGSEARPCARPAPTRRRRNPWPAPRKTPA